MLPGPVVLSCFGTSPGLKGFGLPVVLPAGPIFDEAGDAGDKPKISKMLLVVIVHHLNMSCNMRAATNYFNSGLI